MLVSSCVGLGFQMESKNVLKDLFLNIQTRKLKPSSVIIFSILVEKATSLAKESSLLTQRNRFGKLCPNILTKHPTILFLILPTSSVHRQRHCVY